jgi:hypothetical protein
MIFKEKMKKMKKYHSFMIMMNIWKFEEFCWKFLNLIIFKIWIAKVY